MEHGIKNKWNNLRKHRDMMLYFWFQYLADEDVLAQLKSEIEKERSQISFNELSNVFLLLLISLSFSIAVFVIELITHTLKICTENICKNNIVYLRKNSMSCILC